jgi:fumarate reductase flavoprotein subunit
MKKILALAGAAALAVAIFVSCSGTPAPAVRKVNVKMKPGTYRAEAWGFSISTKMQVAVTVSDSAILSIEVENHDETLPILRSAEQLLIPRMIKNQSVYVDSITGASGSSAGIKAGTTAALQQAIAAAGSDPGSIRAFQFTPEKPNKGVVKTLDYDVLVIGMGGTGSAAAMSAAETQKAAGRPVSVLAIDKAGKYGGTSSVTSEMMAINPPQFMASHNNEVAKVQYGAFPRPLPDTRRDKSVYVERKVLRDAWVAYDEGEMKSDILDLMLDNSGPTLDWLVGKHGFFFGYPQLGVEPAATYFVVFQYNGSFMDNKHIIIGYFDKLWDDYKRLGGKYLLETEAYEYITDSAGNVTGAKARNADGTEYIINAKSVVQATGGYIGNGELTTELLTEEYYPLKGRWNVVGMMQNDGKMLKAALNIGAGTYNIGVTPIVHIGGPRYQMHTFEPKTVTVGGKEAPYYLNDIPMIMAISSNVMAVNRLGKRFTNEAGGLGFLEPWKGGPEFYTIWSQDAVDRVKKEGFKMMTAGPMVTQGPMPFPVPLNYPIAELDEVIDAAIRVGEAYKADSIEDLAAKLKIDPAALKAQVERFNGYCKTGVDAEFHKDKELLVPINEGPYYAFLGAPYAYSTTGGLDINAKLQVLKTDGKTPIGGLYAAGTDTLGTLLTERKAYVIYGGLAQGWAFTSGKLAGENAARAAD